MSKGALFTPCGSSLCPTFLLAHQALICASLANRTPYPFNYQLAYLKCERIEAAQTHLARAKTEQDFYNSQVEVAETAWSTAIKDNVEPRVAHYSFDFIQQIHDAQQTGPEYFKTAQKWRESQKERELPTYTLIIAPAMKTMQSLSGMTYRHNSMELSFMIVGHTKLSPDKFSGMFKKLFRRSFFPTIAEVQRDLQP